MFGVFCACMFIHVFFMFPETAGKTLEEVETMFTNQKGRKYLGTPPWRTAVVKRTLDMVPLHEKESEVAHVDSTEMTPSNPSSDDEHRDGNAGREQVESV